MLPSTQVTLLLLIIHYTNSVKPPGYVKSPEPEDKNPPKYEYAYNIEDEKGSAQGKLETRDGIYALGRYYVQNTDANQNVQYYADDWGFHPYVEYSNFGPHSKTKTHFILGTEAIKALQTNKFSESSVSPKDHINENIQKINEKQGRELAQSQVSDPQSQPQPQVIEQNQVEVVQQPEQVQQSQQIDQQLVYVQQQPIVEQQVVQQPIAEQQLVQQPIAEQQLVQQNVVQEQQQQQQNLETAALYESNSKLISQQTDYDEASLAQQSSGNFGNKINIKIEHQQQPNYAQNSIEQTNRLIQNTQNLVNGQDVININSAIDEEKTETVSEHSVISSTTTSSVTEYKTTVEHVSTTSSTDKSLSKQPIIVADLEEKTENFIKQDSYTDSEQSTVLVTPRPVGTTFLAPITAGVQLQNVENQKEVDNKQKYEVEVQQSVPYYAGKFEYENTANTNIEMNKEEKIMENFELGKTLLSFPVELKSESVTSAAASVQNLPSIEIKQKFAQYQELPSPVIKENFIDLQEAQISQQPVQVPQPYVYERPITVEKEVPVPQPYPVEKIVEKPVPVAVPHIIEKEVQIPQPYPVEKIVEKAVHVPIEVTRYVDRPYPVQVPVPHPVPYPVDRVVEKIVKQPYPVEVKVPVEIKVPVPVEKVVEKKIHVPHYIEKEVPVEKIVEKPIPHYIDRPFPVEVKVPVVVPTPVYAVSQYGPPHSQAQIAQHSQQIHKFAYKNHYPQQYIFTTSYAFAPTATSYVTQKHHDGHLQIGYTYNKPEHKVHNAPLSMKPQGPAYLPPKQTNTYLPPNIEQPIQPLKQESQTNVAYLPPKLEVQPQNINTVYLSSKFGYLPPKIESNNNDHVSPCEQQQNQQSQLHYYTIKPDDYIGLLPPRVPTNIKNYPRKYRNARSNFNSNLRLEYGFMPPLIPSQEIDENGKPIEKGEH